MDDLRDGVNASNIVAPTPGRISPSPASASPASSSGSTNPRTGAGDLAAAARAPFEGMPGAMVGSPRWRRISPITSGRGGTPAPPLTPSGSQWSIGADRRVDVQDATQQLRPGDMPTRNGGTRSWPSRSGSAGSPGGRDDSRAGRRRSFHASPGATFPASGGSISSAYRDGGGVGRTLGNAQAASAPTETLSVA